jgi:hypothetical protein
VKSTTAKGHIVSTTKRDIIDNLENVTRWVTEFDDIGHERRVEILADLTDPSKSIAKSAIRREMDAQFVVLLSLLDEYGPDVLLDRIEHLGIRERRSRLRLLVGRR